MRSSLRLLSALTALACFAPGASFAATKLVDSIAALQSAIHEAVAGDTITLKDGSYTTTQAITVDRAGSAESPITVSAESISGVELAGTHGFNVTASAAHIVIAGFKFTHASGTAIIDEGTSHVRFTRNTFLCTGDGPYLTVSGDDAQIDANEFGAKKTPGNMIAVAGTGSQVARRLWIHHNYLHDLANAGGEGAQMIRLGLMSTQSQSTGGALVEYNLLTGCRGVTELISNRSSGNTYRYNTLLDSPTSQFTLRQGNDSIVYGNYFRNTEGMRIYGDRHQIVSNYFEENHIAIAIGNGAPDPTDGTANKNERPDDCVIAFNTFIDNTTHYFMSRRTPEALGATNTTFANNLIQGGETVAKINGPYTGAIWSGNLLWNTGTVGDLPPEGFKQADPMLLTGTDGIKRLQAGSPAIEAAMGNFPGVAFDQDGQPRPEKKSIGADEISSAPVTAHLLLITDVGPNWQEPKVEPAPVPVPAVAPAVPVTPPIPPPAPAPATAAPVAPTPDETVVTPPAPTPAPASKKKSAPSKKSPKPAKPTDASGKITS